jgi:hypothetical protein
LGSTPATDAAPATATAAGAASASALAGSASRVASGRWSSLGAAERLVVIGGFGVAIIYLLGVVLQALAADTSWLIAAVAGAIAGALVLLPANARSQIPAPTAALVLAAALVAAVVAVLEVLESLFDLEDDLDSGGLVFVVIVWLIALAAVVALVGAARLQPTSVLADGRTMAAAGSRGERIALLGALVFLVGWVLSVTIGVFALNLRTAFLVAVVLVGVVALLAGRTDGWRLPVIWITAGITAIAAIVGLVTLLDFLDEARRLEAAIDVLLPFLVMLAGLAIFVVGVALKVLDERPPASAT